MASKTNPWTAYGVARILKRQSLKYDAPRDWRDLAPPELQMLTDVQFRARSDLWSQIINRVPQEDRIYWYGGMKRTWPGGDGENGAWMTESIAEGWRDRTDMGDIKHGPG